MANTVFGDQGDHSASNGRLNAFSLCGFYTPVLTEDLVPVVGGALQDGVTNNIRMYIYEYIAGAPETSPYVTNSETVAGGPGTKAYVTFSGPWEGAPVLQAGKQYAILISQDGYTGSIPYYTVVAGTATSFRTPQGSFSAGDWAVNNYPPVLGTITTSGGASPNALQGVYLECAPAAATGPEITDVNGNNVILHQGGISVAGAFPSAVTGVTLGGVSLSVTTQNGTDVVCAPLDVFATPLPFGDHTLEVTDADASDSITVTLAPGTSLQYVDVAGVQPYLSQGLAVADGDQMACEASAGGSTLTLAANTDVVYTPAVPDGTTHNRYWWDASSPGWDSGTVRVDRPGAVADPPVWRAAPNPPPATIGVPYSYAIGGLLDGKRPMSLTDAGAALPDGLSYDDSTYPEKISGTPTVSGTVTGIVTRADNGE